MPRGHTDRMDRAERKHAKCGENRVAELSGRCLETRMTQTTLDHEDPRRSRALFTLHEAADYLALPVSTLYDWARPTRELPALITVFAVHGHHPSLPFIGFAEAFVLQAARKAGVPAHRIRDNVEMLRARYPSIEYLLASKRVYTDGAEILVRVEESDTDLEVPRLHHQRQLTDTVRNQLELITYAHDGYAQRLRLPRFGDVPVVMDPLVAAGRPLIRGTRVKDLIDRHLGGDPEEEIAEAFGVPVDEVRELVGAAGRTSSS
jgi:uncharacterized protein (DUF433 family)